jgi:hypothetical protein
VLLNTVRTVDRRFTNCGGFSTMTNDTRQLAHQLIDRMPEAQLSSLVQFLETNRRSCRRRSAECAD